MSAAGVFRADERLELVDGELQTVPPPGPRHSSVVDALARLLLLRIADRGWVRIQNPLRLGERQLFLPDLAILRGAADGYRTRYPSAVDTLLVLEVADTTFERDLAHRLPAYARAGVPQVWLLDLQGESVLACSAPAADGYGVRRTCRGGDCVALPLDGELTVQQLLRA